jgi:hypothetical protein
VTDWLKPGGAPPETASDELFATPDGAVGSPDVENVHDVATGPGESTRALDDTERDDDDDVVARAGGATGASGGYGSPSAAGSSGGSGEATDDTSSPGTDAQSEWLRDAPGGSR